MIKDAPITTTKEFINKHQIHLYAIGEEYYDDPDDEFYKVPREMGILMKTKRTGGISTSELLRRVRSREANDLKRAAPPKQGI